MTSAGKRTRRIAFERGAVTEDDYGGETRTWAPLVEAFAEVLFGTGQERREAAQERSGQSATFIVPWTPTLDGAGPTDRITFDGAAWDIQSVAPVGLSRELHFTAIRAD